MNPNGHTVYSSGKITCGSCGASTGYYKGSNRIAKVCEHIDPKTGKKCKSSRKPLLYKE